MCDLDIYSRWHGWKLDCEILHFYLQYASQIPCAGHFISEQHPQTATLHLRWHRCFPVSVSCGTSFLLFPCSRYTFAAVPLLSPSHVSIYLTSHTDTFPPVLHPLPTPRSHLIPTSKPQIADAQKRVSVTRIIQVPSGCACEHGGKSRGDIRL